MSVFGVFWSVFSRIRTEYGETFNTYLTTYEQYFWLFNLLLLTFYSFYSIEILETLIENNVAKKPAKC